MHIVFKYTKIVVDFYIIWTLFGKKFHFLINSLFQISIISKIGFNVLAIELSESGLQK